MLLKIYLKEIKDCFRDRRTLLLTVLLPVIMMTGLTFFYEKLVSDGEEESYKLAVNEEFDREVEDIFSGFKNIELVKTANPEETLQEGKVQAALILGPNFTSDIENGEKATATIIGDSFGQKSSNLKNIVQNALGVYEKSIISERLEAKGTNRNLVEPFTIEQKEISDQNPNANLLAMLIPLILAIAIGVGSSPAASDLFAGEKEKKTMEALLITPVKRSTLLFSKWLTIATIGSVTGMITLLVVALEINLLTENLKKAVSFGDNAIVIVVLSVLVSIIYAMFTASLLMLTSIIGKTVKESQSYSTPVMMLAMFPTMILSSIGINELSFQHFAVPILNLFSLLKELVFGIIDYEHILITIASNLISMIILFIIGRILFLKDKWVMN
ncbi:ABC transporter permease [Neobacillus novalis]|uniref:ABC transporter permease n=1 Tax=Neobacillus novalis TaxID=220687 RepID=A0AA95MMP1_9BACI|nr:ABC transporter permease [Neobacillus novalis]WHY86872.1 ABC transporter permease [Neobacillus novalis]